VKEGKKQYRVAGFEQMIHPSELLDFDGLFKINSKMIEKDLLCTNKFYFLMNEHSLP